MSTAQTHNTTQIEQDANKATQDNIEAQFNQAFDLHQQGKLSDAVPAYQGILLNNPTHVNSLINLGQALGLSEDKEDMQTAIDCYHKALEQSQCPVIVHYNLGNLYLRSNEIEQAIDSYKRALSGDEKKNQHHLAWHKLGNIYYRQKMMTNAIDAYDNAVRLSGHNPSYYYARARCFMAQKDYTKVIVDACVALTYSPRYLAPLQHLLGHAHYCQNNYDQAEAHFTVATHISPNNYEYWLGLSLVFKKSGQDEKAKFAFEKAKALRPSKTLGSGESLHT